MKPLVSIVICTEKGELERKARLLVRSLRKFGGKLKDVPIYSYQPRKERKISSETIKFFEANQVEYIDLDLNKDFKHYPIANKIISSNHAEQNIASDIIVFLDTDIFFCNEPTAFILDEKTDFSARPVDKKNIGTDNVSDENLAYWQKLYSYLGVNEYSYVTTRVGEQRILSYWNAGHVVARTKVGLMQTWYSNFIKTTKENIIPKEGILHTDQSTLAATVSSLKLNVQQLPNAYNYPINLQKLLTGNKLLITNLDHVVSLHYHNMFRKCDIFNPTHEMSSLLTCEKGRWIKNELLASGVIPSLERRVFNKLLANPLRKIVPHSLRTLMPKI